jgi:homospermidine synthase
LEKTLALPGQPACLACAEPREARGSAAAPHPPVRRLDRLRSIMIRFEKKILFVGFGAVAECTLPILFKLVKVPPRNVTVMDFEDRSERLRKWMARGVRFVRDRVARDNLATLLGAHLEAGDVLVDLAWNIDACEILQWCHDHGVLYVNTSTELWDPYHGLPDRHPTTRTLYWRHMNLRRLAASWSDKGPTAVIEHGANPGLISHFTKQGLLDIAHAGLEEKKFAGKKAETIARHAAGRQFHLLARELGVKVVHCSERDTQVSGRPKEVGEFVNTWSIEGFREEGTTTAEMGWGTHEKWLPPRAFRHKQGPKNQICLAQMGINTWVRSWVPHYSIRGMVVRHGEAFTISDRLTVREKGRAVYRPTVHYAYCPCDAAIASLQELRGNRCRLAERQRIMNDDITSGSDILGALLMGHPYNSWWIGSDLGIEESRRLVPHQNATTMQVAVSVVAATMWMMRNPARGLCVPEDLPHDEILEVAKPWLGRFISTPSDWTPLQDQIDAFAGYGRPKADRRDPWQFRNFLVHDGNE